MAMKKSPLGSVRGSTTEARRRAENDRVQRDAAGKSPRSTILNPSDVRGEYDAYRVLMTTVAGDMRPITADDLASFRRNMTLARKNFKRYGGITARQVIDLSSGGALAYKTPQPGGAQSDIDKARTEIKFAAPVSARVTVQHPSALDVGFLVSAGRDSKVTRHHVVVRFNAYRDAQQQIIAAGPDKSAARRAANWMRKEKLAFDCSCERTRFFMRYIATIGGFNAGRDETGYPKVRNPGLHGVACKHVLRVMAELESSGVVLGFLERALLKADADTQARIRHTATQAEVNALAAKQAAKPRELKTSAERAAEARAARVRRSVMSAATRAAAENPPKKIAPATRRLTSGQGEAVALFAKQFGMSESDVLRRLSGNG